MSDNDVIVNADGPAEQCKMVPIAEWGRMQARIRDLEYERNELYAVREAWTVSSENTHKALMAAEAELARVQAEAAAMRPWVEVAADHLESERGYEADGGDAWNSFDRQAREARASLSPTAGRDYVPRAELAASEARVLLLHARICELYDYLDAARAEAAAMREALKLPLPSSGCACNDCRNAIKSRSDALSTTAGRDLLERLEKQADRIQQMESAIRLAIPEIPQSTDYVVLNALEAAITPR